MILVTGASGLLGATLLAVATDRGRDVAGVYHRQAVRLPGVATYRADLSRTETVRELVRLVRPQWVVHCAAVTDVDWCERNPEPTWKVNVGIAGDVAREAAEIGAGVVYVSTDSVFDGQRGGYTEQDQPAPVNDYARSKLAGEQTVAESSDRVIVLRTNLFGWNCQRKLGLAEWVLGQLEAGTPFPGFEDVVFAPLLVNDLADVIFGLIDRGATGLYHAAASEAISKYEFARLIARVFGRDPDTVQPARLAERPLPARRPLNTALLADKLSRQLGRPMPQLDEMVRRFMELRDNGYVVRLKGMAGAD